jgi:hypothetical protein
MWLIHRGKERDKTYCVAISSQPSSSALRSPRAGVSASTSSHFASWLYSQSVGCMSCLKPGWPTCRLDRHSARASQHMFRWAYVYIYILLRPGCTSHLWLSLQSLSKLFCSTGCLHNCDVKLMAPCTCPQWHTMLHVYRLT